MNKSKFAENRIQKINLIIFLIITINVFNSFFTYPFFYTNDGAAYLSSARSVFTPDAFIAYEWIREPGYPIFLKTINEFLGRSGNYVTAIQAFILVLSLILVAKIYETRISEKNRIFYWIIIGVLSIFSQIYFQYSSLILQQSLFSLILSFYAFLYLKKYKISNVIVLYCIVFFLSVNTSVLFYYFNFLFLILLLYKYVLFRNNPIKKTVINLVFIGLLAFVNILSVKPWENYKLNTLEQNNIFISLEKTNLEGDTFITDETGKEVKVKLQPPTINENFWQQRFSSNAFMNIPYLLFSPKNRSENFVLLSTLLQENFICGGNVASNAVEAREYSQFYFLYSCKSKFLREKIHSNLKNIYFYFYNFIMFLFVIFSFKEIFRKKTYNTLHFIPLIFIILYYSLLLDVDRYMIPIYPFALSIVAFYLLEIKSKFYKK